MANETMYIEIVAMPGWVGTGMGIKMIVKIAKKKKKNLEVIVI